MVTNGQTSTIILLLSFGAFSLDALDILTFPRNLWISWKPWKQPGECFLYVILETVFGLVKCLDQLQMNFIAFRRILFLENHYYFCPHLAGARSKGIYIIIEGEAQVLSSHGDIIANLLPGDFFGELSTLFFIPCTASVQALEGYVLIFFHNAINKQVTLDKK